MKAAWDLGVNTIDTANAYSNGESERIIAKFIKKVGVENIQPFFDLQNSAVQHSSPSDYHSHKVLYCCP